MYDHTQIRDIYSVSEESFLLLMTRKHLLRQFGSKIQTVVAPPWAAIRTATIGPLPLLPGLEREVTTSERIQAADVYHYKEFCKKLDMEDAMKESSIMVMLNSASSAYVEPDMPGSKYSSGVNSRKRSLPGSGKRMPRSRSV